MLQRLGYPATVILLHSRTSTIDRYCIDWLEERVRRIKQAQKSRPERRFGGARAEYIQVNELKEHLEMRYMKVAALAFVSMLTVIMAQAGNAAAVLLWLVCLPGNGLTKYTNSSCLQADSTLTSPWESRGLNPGQEVTLRVLVLTILLRDVGAKSAVTCFMNGSKGEGRIKPNGEGEIVVAEYEKPKEDCRGTEGCETNGVEDVKGIHLNWVQELTENEGKVLGILRPGTKGRPGYTVKCKVLGISVTDTCEEEEGFPEKDELVNARTAGPGGGEELLVKSIFEGVGHAHCSVGGANASRISGLTALLLPGGAVSITKI